MTFAYLPAWYFYFSVLWINDPRRYSIKISQPWTNSCYLLPGSFQLTWIFTHLITQHHLYLVMDVWLSIIDWLSLETKLNQHRTAIKSSDFCITSAIQIHNFRFWTRSRRILKVWIYIIKFSQIVTKLCQVNQQ